MILTKRPARMVQFFKLLGRIPDNFWPGVSVTSAANLARLSTLETLRSISPDAMLWVSYEPVLGPLDLGPFLGGPDTDGACVRCGCHYDALSHECPPGFGRAFDWLIIGAESGANARPFDRRAAIAAKNDCRRAGVAVFFKQDADERGRKIPTPELDGERFVEMPRMRAEGATR